MKDKVMYWHFKNGARTWSLLFGSKSNRYKGERSIESTALVFNSSIDYIWLQQKLGMIPQKPMVCEEKR